MVPSRWTWSSTLGSAARYIADAVVSDTASRPARLHQGGFAEGGEAPGQLQPGADHQSAIFLERSLATAVVEHLHEVGLDHVSHVWLIANGDREQALHYQEAGVRFH